MTKHSIELFTMEEEEFLKGVLELLEINFTTEKTSNISNTYNFECNDTDARAIASMMKSNYEKNFA